MSPAITTQSELTVQEMMMPDFDGEAADPDYETCGWWVEGGDGGVKSIRRLASPA